MPLKSLELKQGVGSCAGETFVSQAVADTFALEWLIATEGNGRMTVVLPSSCPVLKHGPRSLRCIQGM